MRPYQLDCLIHSVDTLRDFEIGSAHQIGPLVVDHVTYRQGNQSRHIDSVIQAPPSSACEQDTECGPEGVGITRLAVFAAEEACVVTGEQGGLQPELVGESVGAAASDGLT